MLSDLRGTPPAAIVLLSDGINTEGETLADAARYARRKGVPLFTVGLGSEQPVRDLELADLLVDEVVFVDDVVNFECKLTATGLRRPHGRRHAARAGQARRAGPHQSDASGQTALPQRVQLPYRPTEVGEFEYVVEVEHLADEARPDNNRQQRLVSVRKEQIRVLLVQAYPSYEFRYLKNMLDRDNTIQLKTVLQDADLEYAELDPTALRVFPVRREELFEYDVLIFGDVNPSFLSPTVMQNINDFVEQKGGGIAFIAGPLYTPLGVSQHAAGRAVSDRPGFGGQSAAEPGRRHRPRAFASCRPSWAWRARKCSWATPLAETARIWQHLPELYWLLESPALKPAARVLAEHPTRLGGRRPQAAGVFAAIRRRRQSAVPCHRRYLALAVPRGRRVLFALLGANHSLSQPLEAAGQGSLGRADGRPPPISPRRERCASRARFIDERLAPAEDDGVTVVVEREGHKNERLKLARNATSRGVFEGVAARGCRTGATTCGSPRPRWRARPRRPIFWSCRRRANSSGCRWTSAELSRAAEETRGRFYRIGRRSAARRRLAAGPAGADRIAAARGAVEPMVAAEPVFGTAGRLNGFCVNARECYN